MLLQKICSCIVERFLSSGVELHRILSSRRFFLALFFEVRDFRPVGSILAEAVKREPG
jgi:hypothetical protein